MANGRGIPASRGKSRERSRESNAPRETASFVALRMIACAIVVAVVLCCLLATFSFAMQSETPRDRETFERLSDRYIKYHTK